jgi:hypothetical protein
MSAAPGVRVLARAAGVPFWVAAARIAAVWIALSGSLGCLADPPTFAPRGQIPPFIIAGQVEPPLGSIYEGPGMFDVSVPFRSEDVNTALDARLYLDLVPGLAAPTPPARILAVSEVPAGNFEEPRWLTMDVSVESGTGCHSLTLVMTYVDNLDPLRGSLPSDDTLAARVVWWLNVGDVDGETTMGSCPGASQIDAVPGGG